MPELPETETIARDLDRAITGRRHTEVDVTRPDVLREGSPARVEYSLTEMGRELAPALRELREWALRWL